MIQASYAVLRQLLFSVQWILLIQKRQFYVGIWVLVHRFILSLFEPPHIKTNKMICAPSEASAQSDQSSLCALRIASKDQGFFMWTAKTLIRLGGQVYLLVCHAAAHLSYGITSKSAIMSWNKSPLMEWICKLLGYVILCYCKYSNVKFTNGGIMT